MSGKRLRAHAQETSAVSREDAALFDLQSPFARIQDLADDAIIVVNRRQFIIFFNQGAEKIFGYAAAEVILRPLDILLPTGIAEIHRKYIDSFDRSSVPSRRMGERASVAGRRRDGTEFPAEASIAKISVGDESMLTVILRDATERMLVEARLKAALREQELLLKELHHRVKNSLQVVSSLLSLQARASAEPDTRRKFEDSQSRVHALAMLHECLYQAGNLARVDLSVYIPRLAQQAQHSYGVNGRIRIHTNLDQMYFHVDSAVPCGLIVNELLSNSFKHAFPDGREGEIRVELRASQKRGARLVVSDNGVGMARQFSWDDDLTLGLRLVKELAQQLSAGVSVTHVPGVCFEFELPLVE